MGEASAIDQEPQDIEHVSFQDLSVENVQEFMPGWEYEPDTKLKSGGPGFIFSKTIDGETWVFSIDKSHPTVRLTSSAGDQHIVEIFEPEPGILNKRNRELISRVLFQKFQQYVDHLLTRLISQ